MASTDKLTLKALKQHNSVHPKLQATTGDNNTRTAKVSLAPSEATTSRKRTTSVLSETHPKVSTTAFPTASMTIFRLVAATRNWQRLAKKKRESKTPLPPVQRLENTYQLEPHTKDKFSPQRVEAILKDVLESRLGSVKYNPDQCRRVTTDLVTVIKARTKTLGFKRYKLVCNVLIMENRGQGSQVVSRGLTDCNTDSYAAHTFTSPTLIAVAHVHGIYFE